MSGLDRFGQVLAATPRSRAAELVERAVLSGIRPPIAGEPITNAGTITGNGTAQDVTLGWMPDLVICKATSGTHSAIWVSSHSNWHRRSDALVNEASTGDGITLTEDGFRVGANPRCNGVGLTVRWFAYRDNGSGNLLQSSYQGSAQAGRKVRVFEGEPLQALMVKRDALPAPVWMAAGEGAAYYYVAGSGMALSAGTSLGTDGVLTCGVGPEINQWEGNLGEGHALLGFCNRGGIFSYPYTGNGVSGRRLFCPWDPEMFWIIALDAATGSAAAGRMWMSSMLGTSNHQLLSNGADGSGVLAGVADSSISLTADTSVNAAGKRYLFVAFKKSRRSAVVDTGYGSTAFGVSVQLDPGAYIDCGTDESLAISGPRSFEWYGSLYTPSTTAITGGAGRNDEGNKQVPIFFRSGGADASDNAVSFGIEICTPQAYGANDGGAWLGSTILVSTHDRWDLASGIGDVLDNNPMNTGYVIDQRKPTHIVLIEDGSGGITVVVNGVVIKERRRSVSVIGRQDARSFNGHRMVIGARQRGAATPAFAYGQQFRLWRCWSRALSIHEARALWREKCSRLAGPIPGDFAEELSAQNASGSVIRATRNQANNGVINGVAVVQGG